MQPSMQPVPVQQQNAKQGVPWWHHCFEIWFAFIEMVIIFLYGFCFFYPIQITIDPATTNAPGETLNIIPNSFALLYPFYQDVHVLVFIGLAFLLVYLSRFSWGAVSIHFLCAVVTIQVYIIFRAFWMAVYTRDWHTVQLDFFFILPADYCVAAVGITWAAVVGRLGAAQMMFLSIIEAFLFALVEFIAFYLIHGFDIGGSSTVFTFGGCFAFGAAIVNPGEPSKYDKNKQNSPYSQYSNVFALFGTLFLWVFFPSFNGARVALDLNYGLQFGNQTHRAVMNTILALTGSCLTTYITTTILNHGKFDVEHIFKATLSGGVIIAGSADLCIEPWAAILAGVWGALMSLCFFRLFHEKFKNTDTTGVLHFITWPGMWGGVISSIFVNEMSSAKLGFDTTILYWSGRTQIGQSGSQLAILGISIAIGFFGGLIGGLLVKMCRCHKPSDDHLYDDGELWVQEKEDVPR